MNVWEAHICPCNCLISKGGMFLNIGEGMKGLTPAQVTICGSILYGKMKQLQYELAEKAFDYDSRKGYRIGLR